MSDDTLFARAADGARLAVTVRGRGPALVMIPGLGSSRRIYDPLITRLETHCRAAVYDQRGIGDSDLVEGPYTMSQLAADTIAVGDALGESSVAVFGASMGGMVAQHVAIEHGDRVDRLILACTGPGGAHAVRAQPSVTQALLGKGARTPGEAYRMACGVMYSTEFQSAHADFIDQQVRQRELRPVRGSVFSAQYAATRQHDTYERLPLIRVPTLVIHGTRDLVMPVGNGEILASRIPGAVLRLVEGGSHLFFHEAPDVAAAAIVEYLRTGL